MKALVKVAKGAGNWNVIDKPEPAVGEGQVKIRVEYIGICGSDLHTFEGHYNADAEGLTIGHEFAGVGNNQEDPVLSTVPHHHAD